MLLGSGDVREYEQTSPNLREKREQLFATLAEQRTKLAKTKKARQRVESLKCDALGR